MGTFSRLTDKHNLRNLAQEDENDSIAALLGLGIPGPASTPSGSTGPGLRGQSGRGTAGSKTASSVSEDAFGGIDGQPGCDKTA
eukprot:scaffold283989_cov34-Prasinocladus_malaysianus.AAC.1